VIDVLLITLLRLNDWSTCHLQHQVFGTVGNCLFLLMSISFDSSFTLHSILSFLSFIFLFLIFLFQIYELQLSMVLIKIWGNINMFVVWRRSWCCWLFIFSQPLHLQSGSRKSPKPSVKIQQSCLQASVFSTSRKEV